MWRLSSSGSSSSNTRTLPFNISNSCSRSSRCPTRRQEVLFRDKFRLASKWQAFSQVTVVSTIVRVVLHLPMDSPCNSRCRRRWAPQADLLLGHGSRLDVPLAQVLEMLDNWERKLASPRYVQVTRESGRKSDVTQIDT
mmetsp:Transcript_9294/g.12000  ORF Transcript_9294/g.12000 Transcript_9294/m.12000 type:complete len:139 (+) Transcript_9294:2867-3283(+)